MHCKPMQTPNRGTVGPSSKTVCNDIPESWGAPADEDVIEVMSLGPLWDIIEHQLITQENPNLAQGILEFLVGFS